MAFLRLKNKRQSEFDQIFEAYKKKIYNTVYTIAKSPYAAEEITQEIMIKLWINQDLLKNINNIDGYIYRTTRNHALNYLRKVASDSRLTDQLLRVAVVSENMTESRVQESEYRELIANALNELSPQRKLVYKLNREDGLNYAEIAEQLDLSKNTVKNHLFAALDFIRTHLIKNGVNPTLIALAVSVMTAR